MSFIDLCLFFTQTKEFLLCTFLSMYNIFFGNSLFLIWIKYLQYIGHIKNVLLIMDIKDISRKTISSLAEF